MNRSYEEVDADDLDHNLNKSGGEEDVEEAPWKAKKRSKPKKEKKFYKQEVDTNVFRIGMSTLTQQSELATGDPINCKGCQAFFNMHSKLEEAKQIGIDGDIWICEFCTTKNEVNIEEEEKPKTKEINYIIEAAA